MTSDQLDILGTRIVSLAVFRDLLADDVVRSLVDYCELSGYDVDERELAGAYAALVSSLYSSEAGSLAAYVRGIVLADENVYLRRLGADDAVDDEMACAVERELETLQAVADLTPDDLVGGLDEETRSFLPRFSSEHIDLSAAYHARVADIGRHGYGIYARYHMFNVDEGGRIVPVRFPDATRLSDLVDYERERAVILDNTRALLKGLPAANILLTGDAGTGKSSTVKAVANELSDEGLRILEVRKEQLREIPAILDELTRNPLKFIIFIDDLSFSHEDDDFAALKAILEGSVSAKSDNVVIYATSNRRHLVRERFSDRDGDDVHRNDTMQEIISLSDRFGIHVSFYKPDKAVYLDIVHKLADDADIDMDEAELDLAAERFATRRGGRSARGARQFVDSLVASE